MLRSSEPWSLRRLVVWAGLLLTVASLLELLLGPRALAGDELGGTAVGVGLALVTTLPLIALDRWPRTAVAISAGGLFTATVVGHASDIGGLAVIFGPGLAAAKVGGRGAAPPALFAMAAVVLGPWIADEGMAPAGTIANLSAIGLATVLGASTRVQHRYALELEQRTRELEALREVETREAVARERLRIARDVHDVVGHALAAIALHARVAARRMERDPDGAARSLAEVAEQATAALAETRDAVGPLRGAEEPAELQPQPCLDDLDELVSRLRASGLAVELHRDVGGEAVPGIVQAAAFRIVQESLSNVVRHAHPAAATIEVRRERAALCVQVRNSGSPAALPQGVGHGLVGMRERAIGLGGSLDAGPDPAGGWRVTARLPIAGTAA